MRFEDYHCFWLCSFSIYRYTYVTSTWFIDIQLNVLQAISVSWKEVRVRASEQNPCLWFSRQFLGAYNGSVQAWTRLLSVHLDGTGWMVDCDSPSLGDARFNLTHVVVFSMLIGLLCMLHHPAQDQHHGSSFGLEWEPNIGHTFTHTHTPQYIHISPWTLFWNRLGGVSCWNFILGLTWISIFLFGWANLLICNVFQGSKTTIPILLVPKHIQDHKLFAIHHVHQLHRSIFSQLCYG